MGACRMPGQCVWCLSSSFLLPGLGGCSDRHPCVPAYVVLLISVAFLALFVLAHILTGSILFLPSLLDTCALMWRSRDGFYPWGSVGLGGPHPSRLSAGWLGVGGPNTVQQLWLSAHLVLCTFGPDLCSLSGLLYSLTL